VVAETQNKHPNLAQVEKHVFQDFGMFSNNYLLQGERLNEISNPKRERRRIVKKLDKVEHKRN